MMVVPWVLLLVVIVVGAGMIKSGANYSNQSSVDQRTEPKKETSAVEQKESAYDEVKPNCAETAISLKSNIVYTTVKHTSVL